MGAFVISPLPPMLSKVMQRTAAVPAPIYTVGSWNEEFEGYAILPSQFNLALSASVQRGFDFVMECERNLVGN